MLSYSRPPAVASSWRPSGPGRRAARANVDEPQRAHAPERPAVAPGEIPGRELAAVVAALHGLAGLAQRKKPRRDHSPSLQMVKPVGAALPSSAMSASKQAMTSAESQ